MNNDPVRHVTPNGWLPTFQTYHLFSQEECKGIIQQSEELGFHKAKTVAGDHTEESDGRKVGILRLRSGPLFDVFRNVVSSNLLYFNSRYGFDLYPVDCGLFQEVHILKYQEGGFHGNHLDLAGVNEMENRKLSLVIQLNEDFEGGSLVLYNADHDEPFATNKTGYGVIFPSWIPHMVHPVTSGTRYTAVIWLRGPRFR